MQTLLRDHFLRLQEIDLSDDLAAPRFYEEYSSRDIALPYHYRIGGVLPVERLGRYIDEHIFRDVLEDAEMFEVLNDRVDLVDLQSFYFSIVHWLVQHDEVSCFRGDDGGCSFSSIDQSQLSE